MGKKKIENKNPKNSELESQIDLEIPDDIKEEVDSQLKPLFTTNFYKTSPQFKLFKKYESKYFSKLEKMKSIFDQYSQSTEVFFKGLVACKLNKEDLIKQNSFRDAIFYLLLVELIGNTYVDQTILLLIGCGHAFHLDPDDDHRYTRHAKTLDDIELPSVPLGTKLGFLDDNGFTFFKKWIDRNLRNQIAHLEYEIDKNGDFLLKNTQKVAK